MLTTVTNRPWPQLKRQAKGWQGVPEDDTPGTAGPPEYEVGGLEGVDHDMEFFAKSLAPGASRRMQEQALHRWPHARDPTWKDSTLGSLEMEGWTQYRLVVEDLSWTATDVHPCD